MTDKKVTYVPLSDFPGINNDGTHMIRYRVTSEDGTATSAWSQKYVLNTGIKINSSDYSYYSNNNEIVVTWKDFAIDNAIILSNGTIETVSSSAPYTAKITNISKTLGLSAGMIITATDGTGSFGSGTMTITSILSSTSISVSSNSIFTAGSVTNIAVQNISLVNTPSYDIYVAWSSTNITNITDPVYINTIPVYFNTVKTNSVHIPIKNAYTRVQVQMQSYPKKFVTQSPPKLFDTGWIPTSKTTLDGGSF